jgi:hypothetical protein
MKTIKSFLGIFAFTALVASCLSNEESYQAGFVVECPTGSGLNVYYANNDGDSLIFFGYGNWAIDDYQFDGVDNSWIDVTTKKGRGAVVYSQELKFLQNTTGQARYGGIRIYDTDHSDAYAPLVFYQYATRGDGSLGSAADVREISGTDGSLVELAYDELHRPLTVRITKDGATLQDLTIKYSKMDSTMTVKDKAAEFSTKFGRDFQPYLLGNGTDTVTYSTYYRTVDGYSYPVYANYVFNYRHVTATKNVLITHDFGEKGVSLNSDSLRNVKQLFFFEGGQRVGNLELTYGANDNRCQSIDANQLVRGVEECDPYLLASLFRYTRSTSVLTKAKGKQGTENVEYNVSTTLNNDKSIHTMTVSKGAESITYTFNY